MNLHYRMSYLSSVFIVTCPWKSIWEVALSKAGANITCPASKELIFCSSGVSFAFSRLSQTMGVHTPTDHYLNMKGVGEEAAQI